jgi:glycosyltransferase involved in cell wall biosynthesis
LKVLFWIAGAFLAAVWLDRARDARGMKDVPDLDGPEWDRDPLADAHATGSIPRVTVIVPARNEETHIQATLQSLLAQDYPLLNVVAVDDRSTDATGQIMQSLCRQVRQGATPERLRVLQISELPLGWLGKTHAMWTAAQQASGNWLLFTDADVVFRPDALRRAIAYAERSQADHLVVFPRVAVETFGGHMMLSFFQLLFVFGHRPWKVADPRAQDSIGFGPFNLVRRNTYENVGTWKVLALEVVEDMKLGELIKQSGFASRCAFGHSLLTHHWARTGSDVVRNLTKNFFAVVKYRPALAFAGCGALLFLHLLPFVGLFVAPAWSKLPFALSLVGIAALYAGMARRSHTSPLYLFTHPFATLLFVYTMMRSMTHAIWHGGVTWRGTVYPLKELRKQA